LSVSYDIPTKIPTTKAMAFQVIKHKRTKVVIEIQIIEVNKFDDVEYQISYLKNKDTDSKLIK
jgi:hypothetical protein